MNTIERTRKILDLLNDASEQLNAYADDLWLSIDLTIPEAIRAGAEQQVRLSETQAEFASVVGKLEELIRGEMSEDARERIDSNPTIKPDKLIVELDRSQPYSLEGSFTYKRPYAIRLGETRVAQHNTWKYTYRWLLQELEKDDPRAFDTLLNADFAQSTRGTIYVSRNKDNLHNPVAAGNLFFEANLSADRTCAKMKEVLQALGRSIHEVTIYLREDRDA